MASHRKPRTITTTAAAATAARTIPAALASVTLLSPQSALAAPAAPEPTVEEVQRKVDDLYRLAGTAQQRYVRPAAPEPSLPPRADEAQIMDRLTDRERRAVTHFQSRRTQAAQQQHQPEREAPEAAGLRTGKLTVQAKLARARTLLEGLALPGPPEEDRAAKAEEVLAFARAQIGKPYVWGASGPSSYDGPGLAQAAWKAAGVALPRAAGEQAESGRPVTADELLPGDLVFFHKHEDDGLGVGVHTGNGTLIHAPSPGTTVREDPLSALPSLYTAVRPA
ncbi:C40 family peptidase [Streptomyces sp. MUM 203J]|uniref:C40 family peptidase n=1 Tax=Streptomyces sp. MUM 203J TaxID=2791990 RepID=UPI001F04FB71|nr:C40 family peptidase [Streptomyces sp. MUM 203J]MCH0542255.1 C40 family peptidase [Streptomyces sp. MUM 203J]